MVLGVTYCTIDCALCACYKMPNNNSMVRYAPSLMQGCTMTDTPKKTRNRTWVQTELAAHEAWMGLIKKAPMSARLMHFLVARMNANTNAVVASQATLGELLGGLDKPVHRNTIRRAIATLEEDRWIEVVQVGGKGGALAYIVNDRVAWGQERTKLKYSRFSAEVIASSSEQTKPIEGREALRQIPSITGSESQLPTGEGLEPPSQKTLEGMEPDLPAVVRDEEGRAWEVNQETGEMQRLFDGDKGQP
jgi:hypothetical protein